MSTWSRPVVLLLCGLLLLTVAIAVLNTLVPLWLTHDALATWQVGVVSSSFYTGNLAGTLVAGWLIKHYGFNRSYYLATAVFAAATAGLLMMDGFWAWSLLRFGAGVERRVQAAGGRILRQLVARRQRIRWRAFGIHGQRRRQQAGLFCALE